MWPLLKKLWDTFFHEMFFVGNELCPFMKWFLWTTNWVPWHMLAACISLYLQSPSVWGQCRIVSPLRWRAVFSDASFHVSLFWVNEDLCPSHSACSFCAVVQCPHIQVWQARLQVFFLCDPHMHVSRWMLNSIPLSDTWCVCGLCSSCSAEVSGGWWDAAEVCWVSDTERDHSLLQAKSEAWSNVLTTWLGDHYVLVFVPALRFFWIHIQCWL